MIWFAFAMNSHFQFGASYFGSNGSPRTVRWPFAVNECDLQVQFAFKRYSNTWISGCITQIRQCLWFASTAYDIKKKYKLIRVLLQNIVRRFKQFQRTKIKSKSKISVNKLRKTLNSKQNVCKIGMCYNWRSRVHCAAYMCAIRM